MIIIHNVNKHTKPLARLLTPIVKKSLKASPVVVTGARQTGKSTLVRDLIGDKSRLYYTLDDLDILERAKKEPHALLGRDQPVTIDEIQKSPELLSVIKSLVDKDRRPGSFLLTGSAHLSMLGRISESLAGRAIYHTLSPMTCAEQMGHGKAGQWDDILTDPSALGGRRFAAFTDAVEWISRGGFPPVVLAEDKTERASWLDGYVKTYLERDVQAITAIEHLIDFRRLMRIAALRTGRMLNQSELARDAGLAQATAHRYLNLLEASCILYRLPAYSVNRTKRLIKTPKLYFCDTGLVMHLAGTSNFNDSSSGQMVDFLLENLVFCDLLAWRETQYPAPDILYWRTIQGQEVDIVIESAAGLIPIEIKRTARPRLRDITGLSAFLKDYPKTAMHGILLHSGETVERLADKIWAVPLTAALGINSL